jgi:hypothetical protein
MALFRRHLRSFAIAWILFQATSLSALVPRACCLAHQMAVLPDCHEQAVEQASMSAQSEAAPTMHHHHDHMQEQEPSQPTPTPAHDCSLSTAVAGSCSFSLDRRRADRLHHDG